jgi:hypothetical protein
LNADEGQNKERKDAEKGERESGKGLIICGERELAKTRENEGMVPCKTSMMNEK